MGSTTDGAKYPQVSQFLLQGFQWYVRRYIRKHFNAFRLLAEGLPRVDQDRPLVVFANHPGWWDPLIATALNKEFFPERTAFFPIDDEALSKYPIFRKLGFYGIQHDSLSGARQFLRVTSKLLQQPHTSIWITPTGRFCDPRERAPFQPGLSHLASNLSSVQFVPLAIEYSFWEERTPEALVAFGDAQVAAPGRTKEDWQADLEQGLADTQQRLAAAVISRDLTRFNCLLEGAAGVGGMYDSLRGLRSYLGLRKFDRRHRTTSTPTQHHEST